MPAVDKDVKIPCPTPQHLQAELETLTTTLELVEKEETWEKLERALIRFAGVTRGGGYKHGQMFIDGVGRHGNGLKVIACMMSDRGRLSGTASDFVQTLAPRLGTSFAPLVTLYLDPLIRLLGRPNKVVYKRTDKCLSTIISNCHLPTIVYELRKGLSDDAVTCRRGCAINIERAMSTWDDDIWGEKGLTILEEIIKKTAQDKDIEVRHTAKSLWTLFSSTWPERVENFSAPLTPTTRKRLDISAAPSQAAPAKFKPAPSRNMAPPPAPVRPITATSTGSSVTHHPARATHQRVKSTSTHPSQANDTVTAVRKQPISSAPASPTKGKTESSSHPFQPAGTSSRPDGLGMPARTVSHNHLPSAMWSHATSPEKKDGWSRPQRPAIPASYSALSLASEALDSNNVPRRLPPPLRSSRPPLTSAHIDEHVFGSSDYPAGPSVLRGPVRMPQLPGGGPRIGPAQRRVVTAPLPSNVRPTLPPSSSSTQLDTITNGKGSLRVKKRVEELEEEIRTNSQPSSPVVVPMPSPQHTAHLSPIASRRPHLATSGSESPLLPVLSRSTNSPWETDKVDNEDLRNVEREADEGNMTMMDTAIAAPRPTHETVTLVAAELNATPANEREDVNKGKVAIESTTAVEQQGVEPILPAQEENSGSQGATRMSATTVTTEDANPGILSASPAADEHSSTKSDTEDEEEEEVVEVKTLESYGLASAPIDREAEEKANEEHDVLDERPEEAAKDIPLPGTPPNEAAMIPLPVDDEMESLPASIVAPAAVWPREPPSRPQVVSESTNTRLKATKTGPPPVARKAPLSRKPAVPPPPTHVKTVLPERKTFKPTTAASRAATTKTAGTGASKAPTASTVTASSDIKPKTDVKLSESTSTVPNKLLAKSAVPSRGNVGKGSTAPAVVARTVSGSSNAAVKTASAVSAKPPVPKAAPSRPTSRTDTVKPPAKSGALPVDKVNTTSTRPAVKASAQVSIPPVRQTKITRKAPLPSFRPVKAKDKATTAKGTSSLSASTASTGHARVKPENIALPLSPEQKAKLPPRDIPLPKSPVSLAQPIEQSERHQHEALADEQADCVQHADASPGERMESMAQHDGPAEETDERPRMDHLTSPVVPTRPSSLKSSPIMLSQPRALSPVLTTNLPPASPSPTSSSFPKRDIAHVLELEGESFVSSLTENKPVETSSLDEIPSPFLSAMGRSLNAASVNHNREPSQLDGHAAQSGPAEEVGTDSQEERHGADNCGRVLRSMSTNERAVGDSMEFSAGSRPAYGERKDVSTPMKAAETLLSKFVGINGTPKGLNASPSIGSRVALSTRDANEGSRELEY